MPRPLEFFFDLRDRQRIAIALARAAATRPARRIDLRDPGSWEFSGFSQNGEDGILEVLRGQQREAGPRSFFEIGAADGIENNTAWLAVAEKYSGLMVEGDARLVRRAERTVLRLSVGSEIRCRFVTREDAADLVGLLAAPTPEVFSLDIDGNDLHVAEALFDRGGLRPRIAVVEYNAVFGPERSVTIPYAADFAYTRAHPTQLYYGVSIAAWRRFFAQRGYRFVTVDRCGVNAFFVDPAAFDPAFLDGVRPLGFAENVYQRRKFRAASERQFELIRHLPLHDVA